MYLFSFDKYAGIDRVFSWHGDLSKFNAGDLLAFGEDIFLYLGEEVSFKEVYLYDLKSAQTPTLVYKSIISPKTMQFVHWMVYTRYSTYKAVLKYFISFELDKLLSREVSVPKKKQAVPEQELYIFPDLWSIYNILSYTQQNSADRIILHSQMTPKQKDVAWRKIKKGLIPKVFCTHSEIFQDWANLTKIKILDPHKWYYANHQEPRYKVPIILEEMEKIYTVK